MPFAYEFKIEAVLIENNFSFLIISTFEEKMACKLSTQQSPFT